MEKTKEILSFWEQFKKSTGTQSAKNEDFEIDEYGDSPELADQLVNLILEGKKTATCCSQFEYEYDKEALPKVCEKRIVVDGRGNPVCIVEIVEVSIIPFCEVDEKFAHEEGEGDRSLEYWRRGHWNYFSRVLPRIGGEAKEDMNLVCERFKVVYQPEANQTVRVNFLPIRVQKSTT